MNKAVCYDCHGIHDIGRTDDPQVGLQMQENLLVTCQTCHPDATTNFTAAWMSHYIPSPDTYPLVYYVNLFYLIFIPVTLGGMALLVVMDISRTSLNRLRRRRKQDAAEALQEAGAVQASIAKAEGSPMTENLVMDPPAAEDPIVEEPGLEASSMDATPGEQASNDAPLSESPSGDGDETSPPPSTEPSDTEDSHG